MMAYSDLLRDPRWQRKRLEIMQRDEFACRICGDDRTTLNVHHLRYIRGRMPWDYDDDNLITLCEPCHARQHPEQSGLTRVSAILPAVLANAAAAGGQAPAWRDILARFGVVDRYDPDLCVICHAAKRADLTRCVDCRESAA